VEHSLLKTSSQRTLNPGQGKTHHLGINS